MNRVKISESCFSRLGTFPRNCYEERTLLPMAAGAAGVLMPRLNLGVANDGPPSGATIFRERRVLCK